MTVQSKTEREQTAKSEGPYQNDKELSTPSKAIRELEKYQEYHLYNERSYQDIKAFPDMTGYQNPLGISPTP